MATGGVWTYYKQLIVCILVCASHVSLGRRVPVRVEAVFTPEVNHILLEYERTPVLVAGEETEVEVWGSGLSRGVEAGLTAAQGVQGAPCRSLVTPPLTRQQQQQPPGSTSHNYAVFTVPAVYTADMAGGGGGGGSNYNVELWLCTREQQRPQYHNNGVGGGGVRARHASWIHQGPDSRLVLVDRPQRSSHKLR